jgi:Tol biopolymer transport system component
VNVAFTIHGDRGHFALRLLAVALGLSILMTLGANGAEGAPQARGALAFVSDREGYASIYLVNADGKSLRKLVDRAWAPTWSPRGRRLAFFHDLGDVVRLEVLDADGTERTRVVGTHNYNFSAFSWSPDETRIAYEAFVHDGIYVANADGSGEQLLVSDTAFNPAWSPDGGRIAFIRREDEDALSVVNIDGGRERQLRMDVSFSVQPAWSPDGTKILFGRETDSGDTHLYVAAADGSGERRLTAMAVDNDSPRSGHLTGISSRS